jgi:hypothetical protein
MQLKIKTSIKHLLIDKANNMMFAIVAVASLVVVFSLLSAKALLSQSSFQHKVLKAKNTAISQLKSNIDAANTLKTQYDVFEKGDPNIIGGQGGTNSSSTGPSDGDNARIVLDALPDKYDFPALTSSVEKIVNNDHVAVQGITGTDNTGLTTSPTSPTATSGQSQAQTMAVSIAAQTDYTTSLTLMKDLERSIRPFDVTNLQIQGSSSNLSITIQANTYYQPGITLQIGSQELKQ